ncbi:MAG TPA: hypothetical protein VEX86_26690 [Longimicrobium sp.]|nr:hypothetical protein [Longimicrobium sp.]
MRRTRFLLVALALFAAAGCARTDGITAPERTAAPRHDAGGTTPTVTSTTQADTVTRGNGLIGSGG